MAAPTVFLSHTSELNCGPREPTYVEAAKEAVLASGCAIEQMDYFGPSGQPPAAECERRVLASEVYVGVFGHRYGSPVRERPEVSYTELEFNTARSQPGKEVLVFLLTPGASNVPAGGTTEDWSRQQEFRRRVQDGGLTVKFVHSPENLQEELRVALTAYRARRASADGAGELRQRLLLDLENKHLRREYLLRRGERERALDRDSAPLMAGPVFGAVGAMLRTGALGGYLAGALGGLPAVVLTAALVAACGPWALLLWPSLVAVAAAVFLMTHGAEEAAEARNWAHGAASGAMQWLLGQLGHHYARQKEIEEKFFLIRFFYLGEHMQQAFAVAGYGLLVGLLAALLAVLALLGGIGSALGAGVGLAWGLLAGTSAGLAEARALRALAEELGPLPPGLPADRALARKRLL